MMLQNCKRRDFLKVIGMGTTVLALGQKKCIGSQKKKRPNVILVMTDDQGYGDLRCLGNKYIITPNIDKFYKESVHLTNFHVCPTCSPTRASLMTGRYCSRTGVWHTIMGRSLLRKDEITMADVFSKGGYRTGIFGKWHLGDNYPFRPQDRGFQETVVNGGGGVTQTPDYWGNDYFDDTYWHNGKPEKYKGYCTDVFFNEAIKFIEEKNKKPFFCYIPTNAAHGPYIVAEKYSNLYKNKPVRSAKFCGMITNIDENMGRLLKKLKEFGLEENTILIFMTDNGTSAGYSNRKGKEIGYNAGLRGTKGSEYDGGHRVPFFIRYPAGGLDSPRDINRISAHTDVLPTLAAMCGLQKPRNVLLDGIDLTPLLTGKARNWPDRTIVVDSQRIEHPVKERKYAVMTDRWRLVDGTKLYDMKVDRGQQHDVSAKYPQVVKKLHDAYNKWWDSVSTRFDEYCYTILGSKENPTRLTAHDWHSRTVPWNQGMISKEKLMANGFWAVDVATKGTYEFELRRWPVELDKAIGKAVKAKISIANTVKEKAIGKDAHSVVFSLDLKPGKTKLNTWFFYKNGKSRGAYFCYVKKVK